MKTKEIQRRAKFVCFDCRKSFERNWIIKNNFSSCPECGNQTIRYDHKFRSPKKTNDMQWRKVEFLRDYGFYFQRVFDEIEEGHFVVAKYPIDLNAAKEFVIKYKEQSIKLE